MACPCRCHSLEKEIAELRGNATRAVCVYCGESFHRDASGTILEHIGACEKRKDTYESMLRIVEEQLSTAIARAETAEKAARHWCDMHDARGQEIDKLSAENELVRKALGALEDERTKVAQLLRAAGQVPIISRREPEARDVCLGCGAVTPDACAPHCWVQSLEEALAFAREGT